MKYNKFGEKSLIKKEEKKPRNKNEKWDRKNTKERKKE